MSFRQDATNLRKSQLSLPNNPIHSGTNQQQIAVLQPPIRHSYRVHPVTAHGKDKAMLTIHTAAPDGAIAVPPPEEAADAARRWLAQLGAGQLTAAAPPRTTPAIEANRAATAALFRRLAAGARIEGR
jgi:hypothetical protein